MVTVIEVVVVLGVLLVCAPVALAVASDKRLRPWEDKAR